jgi:hypothetical protein
VRGRVLVFMLGHMRNTNPELGAGRGPRRSRSDWTSEIARWRESGLSATQYALEHKLKVARLLWWSSQLKRGRKDDSARVEGKPIAFLPVRTRQARVESSASEPACIEVVLANGRRVRVVGLVDVAQLGRVLTAAEGGDKC